MPLFPTFYQQQKLMSLFSKSKEVVIKYMIIYILLAKSMQSKSMDWFLYDNDLRHERVNQTFF